MSAKAIERFLYNDCGLKGLSGISNDVRELLASSDPRAKLALDYFVYRIALFTGMLAAAMGGIDGFVFTAGIGENAPAIREAVMRRLSWLGLELDHAANAKDERRDLAQGVARCLLRHSDRRRADDREPYAARAARACGAASSRRNEHDRPLFAGPAQGKEGAGHRHRQRSVDRLGMRQGLSRVRRRCRRHLPQRQVEALRGAAGQGDRGADLHAARPAERGPARGRFRDDREEVGQARHRACIRSPSRRRRICRAASSTARRTASCWPWSSRAGRSSGWQSWPSRS